MPIHPDNRGRYPADWKAISLRIRFERAGGRCEFTDPATGERCTALHGEPHPITGSKVVLTTAHLNHQPEDCSEGNLKAGCQRCHLAHDREHHATTRRERAEKRKADARAKIMEVAGRMAFELECATGRKVAR